MIKGKQNPRNTFCFKVTHIAENAPGTAVTKNRCGGLRDGQILLNTHTHTHTQTYTHIYLWYILSYICGSISVNPKGIRA